MKTLGWLIAIAAIALLAYGISRWHRRWQERERASEDRLAVLVAQARPGVPPDAPAAVPTPAPAAQAAPPAPDATLPVQKLLFEAAAKAADAGEPALSIQLYARLIARFPHSAFVEQARGAVQTQKQRLAKP